MKRVVAVLGGNAFAPPQRDLTMETQFDFAHRAAERLLGVFEHRSEVLISHGNGPQVGHILRRVEAALGDSYRLPLDVCVAESEGELGLVLAQALRNTFTARGVSREVVSLLTQVEVSRADPAFASPDKPIGPVISTAQASQLGAQGIAVSEDPGRGLRRVVPSPQPLRILELKAIQQLLQAGFVVVAAGGGGIPVENIGGQIRGVEAVVDKDLTAALLADQLNADLLLIVTCVPNAYLYFGSERQAPIGNVTTARLAQWKTAGHFAPGSMAPKVDAAIRFVTKPGRRAVVCDIESLTDALRGAAGTIVEYGSEC